MDFISTSAAVAAGLIALACYLSRQRTPAPSSSSSDPRTTPFITEKQEPASSLTETNPPLPSEISELELRLGEKLNPAEYAAMTIFEKRTGKQLSACSEEDAPTESTPALKIEKPAPRRIEADLFEKIEAYLAREREQ